MSLYIPAIIWVICAFVCMYIAKNRNVKPTLLWKMVVVFLGPLAIPLVFLAKPEQTVQ